MKTARGLSFLLLLCIFQLGQSVAFDPSKYDFLNATSKPYCIHNVLSPLEVQEQLELATVRIDRLNASYPNMKYISSNAAPTWYPLSSISAIGRVKGL